MRTNRNLKCPAVSFPMIRMYILGITGSPRGRESRTGRLLDAVLKGAAEAGASVERIDAAALDIGFCTGCTLCYDKGECPKKDDYAATLEKMLRADGIVLGSPNYIDNVTAQMKVLLDRMADVVHCQRFVGKYGCAVSTAGGSGASDVAAYLNSVLGVFGADTVGAVSVDIGADPESLFVAEEKAFRLGQDLAAAIAEKRAYPDQQALHAGMAERMKALVTANRDRWRHEYDYWHSLNR